jgi:hypothetical protein
VRAGTGVVHLLSERIHAPQYPAAPIKTGSHLIRDTICECAGSLLQLVPVLLRKVVGEQDDSEQGHCQAREERKQGKIARLEPAGSADEHYPKQGAAERDCE